MLVKSGDADMGQQSQKPAIQDKQVLHIQTWVLKSYKHRKNGRFQRFVGKETGVCSEVINYSNTRKPLLIILKICKILQNIN